ncbi:unnamed protein product [Gadus morhua 'NCC']
MKPGELGDARYELSVSQSSSMEGKMFPSIASSPKVSFKLKSFKHHHRDWDSKSQSPGPVCYWERSRVNMNLPHWGIPVAGRGHMGPCPPHGPLVEARSLAVWGPEMDPCPSRSFYVTLLRSRGVTLTRSFEFCRRRPQPRGPRHSRTSDARGIFTRERDEWRTQSPPPSSSQWA